MTDNIKQRLRMINLTGCAVVVSVLAGTVALGVAPMYTEGKRNIKASTVLTSELHDLDALNLKIARIEVEKSSRETRLSDVESLLPNANAMNQFVQELAHVAEEAGLQVDGVFPSKELKDAGTYKSMSVSVRGTGDWDTCYHFLTGLRGIHRKLTRLDSLTLESVKDKPVDQPLCQINVEISTLIAR
jgi:Tfp pilus assembly protein PilO